MDDWKASGMIGDVPVMRVKPEKGPPAFYREDGQRTGAGRGNRYLPFGAPTPEVEPAPAAEAGPDVKLDGAKGAAAADALADAPQVRAVEITVQMMALVCQAATNTSGYASDGVLDARRDAEDIIVLSIPAGDGGHNRERIVLPRRFLVMASDVTHGPKEENLAR